MNLANKLCYPQNSDFEHSNEELNSQSRLKYYWKLFVFWNWLAKEESENWTYVDKWMKIRKAVLEGK